MEDHFVDFINELDELDAITRPEMGSPVGPITGAIIRRLLDHNSLPDAIQVVMDICTGILVQRLNPEQASRFVNEFPSQLLADSARIAKNWLQMIEETP